LPPTLKALYQQHTGDTTTHQRTIGAALASIDKRRRQWIAQLLEGRSYREIAAPAQLSPGTVQDGVKRAFAVMKKTAEAKRKV